MLNLPGAANPHQIVVKAVVLGDTEVGKTSLCNRFLLKKWDPVTSPTVSASCLRRDIQVNGHDITYCIWDTAGQERFRSISPLYYRGAHVGILVVDLTSRKSLDAASAWAKELRDAGPVGIPIIVAGNKNDLVDSVEVTREMILEIVGIRDCTFVSVSALTGDNVDELFMKAAILGLGYIHGHLEKRPEQKNEAVVLAPEPNVAEKSNCC
jgi:small GTP-binding protein